MHSSGSTMFRRVRTVLLGLGLVLACSQAGGAHDARAGGVIRGPKLLAQRTSTLSPYRVLYRFRGYPLDGSHPAASLITDGTGTLYGTTSSGGLVRASGGRGTVFALTVAGKERVLHSFGGCCSAGRDGEGPVAALIDVGGTLYGTTAGGGTPEGHFGSVFALRTSGSDERVLHGFAGPPHDGAAPRGALLARNGALYGTTSAGGSVCDPTCNGTIFEVIPTASSATEKVLHNFAGVPSSTGVPTDGALPLTDLMLYDGDLIGTTYGGGIFEDPFCVFGCGTIFALLPSGKETLAYDFAGRRSTNPTGGLVDVNGALYGTTAGNGCGSVYKLTASGVLSTLHAFGGSSASGDGCSPNGGLLYANGAFYGTTSAGGNFGCTATGTVGCGTIFRISLAGSETIVHDFAGGSSDGSTPLAGLTDVNGVLYGTTDTGGPNDAGTVFAYAL